jgi:hypothetical protein
MRAISRACQVIGITWLLLIQLYYTMGMDFRAVMSRQERILEDRSYSGKQLRQRVVATAETAHELAPNIAWPVFLIVIGLAAGRTKPMGTRPPSDVLTL